MGKKKELKWGETPFDKMTHEKLLLTSKRMYMALMSLHGQLAMYRVISLQNEPNNPYWGKDGRGYHAMQLAEAALEPLLKEFGDEQTYRSYFRYAECILFPNLDSTRPWLIRHG